MTDTYWRNSYDRLEQPRGTLSGDDLKQIRALKARRTLCNRAMRAGTDGRAFDAGDPKTGRPWPPGEDIWQAHQCGIDEAAFAVRWSEEQRQARAMTDMGKQARKVLREHRKVERVQAERRAQRARKAWKAAALIAPVWSRRIRRWRKALAGR
jgi:hypothetical protein